MKYNWVLKSVKLRTPLKDDYEAAKEVADALKKSKKFDGTKIFLCRQDDGIVVPNGEKQDPYLHSFTFVSNDKDELQKLADNFNKILFPNHEKDELLGVNVRKNTDNYNDVFESKKIKTEESEKLEEAVGNTVYVLWYDGGHDKSYILGIYTQKKFAIKAAQQRKLMDDDNVKLREYYLDREFSPGIGNGEADYK